MSRAAATIGLVVALVGATACSGNASPRALEVNPGLKDDRQAARLHAALSEGAVQSGMASWYGPKFHGRKTANGETYDMDAVSAAHKTLPFGTVVRVRNLDNGRTVDVRINDRGPFIRGRIIDLSRAAARRVDMIGSGVARVELTLVAWPADKVIARGVEVVGPWVQVGAFQQEGRARTLALQVREHHRAFDVYREGSWYKVQARLGSNQAAAKLIERLESRGIETLSVKPR